MRLKKKALENFTKIIPNDQGNRLTPSMVSFKGNEILVGDSEYNLMATNSPNTLFDVKKKGK